MPESTLQSRVGKIGAIGIDIGGTFVDIVLSGENGAGLIKLPSTPGAPHRGVLGGLGGLIGSRDLEPESVRTVAHGSTVATNALLEGTWARTALVTTRGFRDVLEIGRQNRSDLYDLAIRREDPIVPRDLRFELEERVDADGRVVVSLDPKHVLHLVPRLRAAGVEAIAVVLLFSYLNPAHEQLVGRILSESLGLPVTLSSDVLPEFREYERTSTTVICAALRPVIGAYLGNLERGAAAQGLQNRWRIMQSSGAVTDRLQAEAEPVRILLSGPAAGVQGAWAIGALAGEQGLITMDMGGTSCDVALIRDGVFARTTSGSIGGYPVGQQMIDIHTIGAGGGSVAWIDSGGALRVGPRSAGAVPGPACYGRGGTAPTVTDAHAVLGHLVGDRALGGLPCLDVEAAQVAIESMASPLGLSNQAAAEGILEIADAAMERAIRVISIERGHDPRDYALLAFGGAGPLHAVSIAKRLSIPRVLVPATAGVLSALGLLTSEVGYDASQSIVRRFSTIDVKEIRAVLEGLRDRGRRVLAAQGYQDERIEWVATADLRYAGQSHELNVPIEEPESAEILGMLACGFHDEHEKRFGHSDPSEEIELVTLRVRTIGPPTLQGIPRLVGEEGFAEYVGQAWFAGVGEAETRIVSRASFGEGDEIEGPMIVVGSDSTLVVPPNVSGRSDAAGTIILEVR